MKMFASLALFGMFAGVGLSGNITCDDAQSDSSCDETTLSGTDILCRGYKSCYESDLTCSEDCMCGGLLACHGSEIVATDDATCFGEYGCKYATITAEDIWCDGRYGCKFTNLTASNLLVNLSVIPTATPTLPSLLAKTTTIPSPKSVFPLSTSFLNSFGGKPSTF